MILVVTQTTDLISELSMYVFVGGMCIQVIENDLSA